MRTTQRSSRTIRRRSRDRGSALLVTLIVVAGLSLLGLAFVGVSETESAIAANQRDGIQTQAIAEAGAKAVMEWFQNPSWARGLAIMPANNPAPAGMKRTRIVDGVEDVYKPLSTQILFDKPYRPARQHRFFGDEETADITITDAIDATTLTNLNTFLFGANSRAAGRITEIRVYAPPIVGGNLVGGFWTGGDRFGTATIRVTAEKWSADNGGTLRARRIVRMVVGEFPMPIPAGPIQTASNAAFGGSFDVHWGDEVALGNLNPSVARTRIPWANAFNRPAFERGYDNVSFPVDAANPINFLNELIGKSFQDPWAGSRARGTNSTCGTCSAYANTATEGQPVHAAFQGQVQTVFPTMRAVTFPTIQYSIWKRIAQQGKGTKGIFYFEYVNATNPPQFKRNGMGDAHPIEYWVNVRTGGSRLGPGFYFFETKGKVDPQLPGGATNTAVLTPGISWNAFEFGSDFLMSGFIYLNIAEYRSTGGGSSAPTLPYNMPGEIFRDVGHRRWIAGAWELDGAGQPLLTGAGDGEHSFQDINGNGKVDIVVEDAQRNFQSFDPGAVNRTEYFPKTWTAGCTAPPASGAPGASDCSEPHEPFLNFIYPNNPTGNVTIGWEPHASQTRRPRDLNGTSVPNCNTNPEKCTSNGFDRDGALVDLPVILSGVLYNEGTYSSQGNVDYFGSVLIRGSAGATGNAQIWFDEKLVKDNWAPPGMPRVIVYSSMTDEQ
ncbi:MAG TPA: pilus assembly PilX N-terminal domain-containing protein [Thermoanaerobaculia bacterium]|nr:pilus assembly PilX N-terminal domain-containing protein [Thermoanaerobaculia bacterium]